MIYRNYWAVAGRMCGDHEDHVRFFQQCTYQDAIDLFRIQVYEDKGVTLAERELAEANGEGVFVNLVLASDSPIEEGSA